MFSHLAKWYLSWRLRKMKNNSVEIVIRSDGWTYYERNKKKEEWVKETAKEIKSMLK